MIVKTNLKLFDWQKDFLSGFFGNIRGSVHTVLSPRQRAKTTTCMLAIMKISLEHNGAFSLMIEPTLKQARKVFKEIVKVNQNNTLISKANESLLEITFRNGSILQFLSSEQGSDAMRGYTVTGVLIIDEAAFIPDEIYQDLLATVSVHRAPIILVSTPRFKTGFFYENFISGGKEPHIFSYDWSKYDTSIMLDDSKLEYYRRKLPDIKFRQEFLGQFCDINTESAFGDFRKILSNDIAKPWVAKSRYDMPTPTDNYFCHMGIDWGSGSGQDETAIVIFNNLKQQVYIEHFSDLDTTQTINRICELIKIWKPKKVVAEVNGIGKVYYDLLRKAVNNNKLETALKSFTTTNDSKNRIISQLQVAIQNNDIQLLDDNYQTEQLSQYLPELTKTGKVTFNAASGYHDDLVMANAICFDSLCTKSYTIL